MQVKCNLPSDTNSPDIELAMLRLVSSATGTVKQAATYHLQSGGSRVRARLGISAASALSLSKQTGHAIAVASELLHNASLVHDDLQDLDAMRRGKTAVWKVYGKNTAICVGDMLISAAYSALAKADHSKLVDLLAHTHQRVCDVTCGQHADLENQTLTLEEYLKIARAKSGPLLGLPIELCLIAADHTESISQAINASNFIAAAYQIADDILDAQSDLQSGDLNVITFFAGSLAERTKAAQSLAIDNAQDAIKLATSLPSNVGDGLVSLALKFLAAPDLGAVA